jgi:uncharacterized protein DUF6538
MRISMNVIKNEHGVFHVRKKVPKKLEEATATVMGSSKQRVAWLKKSLGTKDRKAAKVRAPSVGMISRSTGTYQCRSPEDRTQASGLDRVLPGQHRPPGRQRPWARRATQTRQ